MIGLSCLVFLAASMLSILCKNLLIAKLIKLIGYSRLRKVERSLLHSSENAVAEDDSYDTIQLLTN